MIYSYTSTNKYIKYESCDYITRVAFEITKKTEQKNYPFARSTHSFKIAILANRLATYMPIEHNATQVLRCGE